MYSECTLLDLGVLNWLSLYTTQLSSDSKIIYFRLISACLLLAFSVSVHTVHTGIVDHSLDLEIQKTGLEKTWKRPGIWN